MKASAVKEYGKADLFEVKWGLKPKSGQKIAAIIMYSGSIEYYLERAIWKVQELKPKGIRPETDAKIITHLISMLESFAATLVNQEEQTLLSLWCEAARSGFIIRNNIAHGVAINIDNNLAFMRNPRWHGEKRKRKFGDLWADYNTLDLVREAHAVLLRIIIQVEAGQSTLLKIATPPAQKALREARSILGEFSSQDYNPSFEKY
jgi:hypothetical protein